MIEIRTQAQFDVINSTIANLPLNGELIRVYPLEGNVAYVLTSPIVISRDNVIIEGVSLPKMQSTITGVTDTLGSMIVVTGTSGAERSNVTIRGLNLLGNKANYQGRHGIYCSYVGKSFATGLTTGTYNRYNVSTNGATYIHKKGIMIKDCIIQNNSGFGIVVNCVSNSDIQDCTVQNNNGSGLLGGYFSGNRITGSIFKGNGSDGIYINTSANSNIISNNSFQNNMGSGVSVAGGCYNAIIDNLVQNNYTKGIYLDSASNNNTLVGNTVQNNVNTGILLSSSHNNAVTGNTVLNNGGHGIYSNGNANTLLGNIVLKNGTIGIIIAGGVGSAIVNNVSQNNKAYGISLQNTNDKMMIYGNVALGNEGTPQYSLSGTNSSYSTNHNI